MENKKLGVFEAYGLGWQSFRKNWVVLIGFMLLALVINGVLDYYGYIPAGSYEVPVEIAEQYENGEITVDELIGLSLFSGLVNFTEEGPTEETQKVVVSAEGSIAVTVLGIVVSLVLGLAGMVISVQAARGDRVTYESVVGQLSAKKALFYFAASILVTVCIALGLLLLIIPGIIFLLMFALTYYLVADQDMGPIEAMKKSKDMTQSYRWQILGYIVLAIPIALLGAVVLLVGLLVAIPWIMQTMAVIYLYLNSELDQALERGETAKEKEAESETNESDPA